NIITITMDHEDQYNQNVDLENFDFLHMVLNEKSVLQIKSKERLNDNATYGFTLSQNPFSEDEINFEGYGVRLWMTADSVPPVISKVEIFSNNDSGDQEIAKAGDEVTLRITSIEDVQKPNLEINSQPIDHSQIGYNTGANQNIIETIYLLSETDDEGFISYQIDNISDLSDNPSILSLKRGDGELTFNFFGMNERITPNLLVETDNQPVNVSLDETKPTFNVSDDINSINYEVTNNEEVWNNLDDGKLLGSGNIAGAVRYDKTKPEITKFSFTSTNLGENV
ncbi:MAG: hypothetical protein VX003_08895, partial [SAR324 cluster bacterium]|nr:hypothetical protein [SAR324 cluster bacterium]